MLSTLGLAAAALVVAVREMNGMDMEGVTGLGSFGSFVALWVTMMLVALAVMSVTWMSMIAVLVLAQKLQPAKVAIDVPLALAIIGLGILTVLAHSSVPGLTPPM